MGFGRKKGKQEEQQGSAVQGVAGRASLPTAPPLPPPDDKEMPSTPKEIPPTHQTPADDDIPTHEVDAPINGSRTSTSPGVEVEEAAHDATPLPTTPPAVEATPPPATPLPLDVDDDKPASSTPADKAECEASEQTTAEGSLPPVSIATGVDTRPVLTYFSDMKGRNELIRLVFAMGGVEYVDDLINAEEYRRRRDSDPNHLLIHEQLPFGQLPTLRVGPMVIGQSCAIARYAAKGASLYPTDDAWQAARCDAVVDVWRGLLDAFYDTMMEKRVNAAGKLEMAHLPLAKRGPRLKRFIENTFKPTLNHLEEELRGQADNGVNASFCPIGPNKLCFADLAIFDVVQTVKMTVPLEERAELRPSQDRFPESRLQGLLTRVGNMEAIQSHLKKYPYRDTTAFFQAPFLAMLWELFATQLLGMCGGRDDT